MLATSLQAAVNNMTNELMLLGVATLILSACQKNVGSICSESLPGGFDAYRILLTVMAMICMCTAHNTSLWSLHSNISKDKDPLQAA